MCWNPWSPVGGTVWEGLKSVALLEETYCLGRPLRIQSLVGALSILLHLPCLLAAVPPIPPNKPFLLEVALVTVFYHTNGKVIQLLSLINLGALFGGFVFA